MADRRESSPGCLSLRRDDLPDLEKVPKSRLFADPVRAFRDRQRVPPAVFQPDGTPGSVRDRDCRADQPVWTDIGNDAVFDECFRQVFCFWTVPCAVHSVILFNHEPTAGSGRDGRAPGGGVFDAPRHWLFAVCIPVGVSRLLGHGVLPDFGGAGRDLFGVSRRMDRREGTADPEQGDAGLRVFVDGEVHV